MREVEILKKKQLKCYLYTRVSTSMQVDGYSLDAQRDKLRKYAAYEDMVVAGEYSDEGFSGKNIQGRQEFQRMLNDIQDGKDDVPYVLVFTPVEPTRLLIRLYAIGCFTLSASLLVLLALGSPR